MSPPNGHANGAVESRDQLQHPAPFPSRTGRECRIPIHTGPNQRIRCFRVFGVTTAIGRPFTESDNQAAGTPVVILNRRFWQRRFSGDRTIRGRSLLQDDRPYTVIGVLEDKS
jgi:MacB-like periplasmic core domain